MSLRMGYTRNSSACKPIAGTKGKRHENSFHTQRPTHGTERSYNGFRLARALSKHDGNEIRLFLLGDAALRAKAGQKVPDGYYNIEFFAQSIMKRGGEIGVCGMCMDARGLKDEELISGAQHSTLEHLAEWTLWAEKVLVF